MMKQIYISTWILLAIAASVTVLTGSFDSVALMVFSLIALGLVQALALWSVYAQTRNFKTA